MSKVRPLSEADLSSFEKATHYFAEQQEGKRSVAIIEDQGRICGYGSLFYQTKYPYFREQNIPEINDVWIFDGERAKGYGTQLITYLENLAREKGYPKVGIGVGLYRDYGPAQRLYLKLGYVFDGKGSTYNYQPVVPGQSYRVDDDLIIWLVKSIR